MKVNYFISIIFGEIRYCLLFFFLTAKKECKNRYDDYFFQIVYNVSAMASRAVRKPFRFRLVY